jgi:hypothetical protein
MAPLQMVAVLPEQAHKALAVADVLALDTTP